ncbi:hypothetical protein N5J31_02020 [Acinetobacter johnsonii]|jgi:hypothetical protein|uniref:hypothetical protein n=1 Tax=Acinetobacter johnsonii TaxID=40214 RepID=UPI00244CCCEC|nr:hypothetical protein [Acinetobacter johnsonii]MDH2045705.1 hypothetical protein [Acinetobacter johnsonii]
MEKVSETKKNRENIRNALAVMKRGERITWSDEDQYFDILFNEEGKFDLKITRIGDHRSGRFALTPSLKDAVDFIVMW